LVTTEGIARDQLASVLVGDYSIALDDPTQFLWLGSEQASQHFLVRLPSTVSIGSELRVQRKDSQQASYPLSIVSVAGLIPSSPYLIWPLSNPFASEGVFPIGTSITGTSFPLLVDQANVADAHWRYDLHFRRACAGADFELTANEPRQLIGTEVYYEAPREPGFLETAQCGSASSQPQAAGAVLCHEIDGEYQLDATHDEVRITIHRNPDETYRGGWVLAPPGASDGAVPPRDSEHSAFLVLTSQLTGRQLVISHPLGPTCDER
jgi:hypothetical protein